MNQVILLDIDGVLVQPCGYRAALRATVQRFVGDFNIEENLLTGLERRGISSEWDMSPLIIAAYWEDVLSRQPVDELSQDAAAVSKLFRDRRTMDVPKHLTVPEFELVTGMYPAEAAFRSGCFSHIPEALRRSLLTESRNIHKSATMRVFQHHTLGSKNYEAVYQLPAEFEVESLLLAEDKPNINAGIVQRLRHPANHIAAFTARPSKPPIGTGRLVPGYAPEAELALSLVGMKDIPLIGFGKLEYIAAQHGLDPATLVKPSPFQALAGVLAAWTGDELSALTAAHEWHKTGKLMGSFHDLPRSFELVVVEDTLGGIRSAKAAGEILRKSGFGVTVRALGLTLGAAAKAAAFVQAGVPHFDTWESLAAEIKL